MRGRKAAAFIVMALASSNVGAALAAEGRAGPAGQGKGDRIERLKSLDVDKDGAVTAEEFLVEQRQRFARRDADKDGKLAPGEALGGRPDRVSPEQRAERLIKRYDTNTDGRVTREEFEAGQRAWFAKRDKDGNGVIGRDEQPRMFGRRRTMGPEASTLAGVLERSAGRFKTLDVNGDGSVDAAEYVQSLSERTGYRIRRIMHRLDADRDGIVTEEEFLASGRQRFTTIDLDDNGRITAEDLSPQVRALWTSR